MRSPVEDLDTPPSAEELAAASRLAEALEGRQSEADPASLAVVGLLRALDERPADELAARRTRKSLISSVRSRRSHPLWRVASLAAAAALVFSIGRGLVPTTQSTPTPVELARREADARAAVTQVLASLGTSNDRLRTLTERLRDDRTSRLVDVVRSSRLSSLSTYGAGGATGSVEPMVSPTPGGLS